MTQTAPKLAIIYVRVSSLRQATQGHGLESQTHRCEQYAKENGYQVIAIFEDAFTGKGDFFQRQAMKELLAFLDENIDREITVIFDDLKRFARDLDFHWKLRTALKERNATPKCLNFNFEDTPEGEFVENVIASVGQLERKQNQRQVCQKMKARMERGYWVFPAPLGYEYKDTKEHGKILVPKQPEARYVQMTLNKFASGVFRTQTEAGRYLEKKLGREEGHARNFAKKLLTQSLYAGLLDYPAWEIADVKAKHKALISIDCLNKITAKLEDTKHSHFIRKDNNDNFPLRRFVQCSKCQKPLTASLSTGKSRAKFAYYRCMTPNCIGSIRKDDLEEEFCKLLKEISPKKEFVEMIKTAVIRILEDKEKLKERLVQRDGKRIGEIKKLYEKALDYAFQAKSDTIRLSYESKAEEYQKQIQSIEESRKVIEHSIRIGTLLEKKIEKLTNPLNMWNNGSLKKRQAVQKRVFKENLTYDQKSGFGTPRLSFIYEVFFNSNMSESSMVDSSLKSSCTIIIFPFVRSHLLMLNTWKER